VLAQGGGVGGGVGGGHGVSCQAHDTGAAPERTMAANRANVANNSPELQRRRGVSRCPAGSAGRRQQEVWVVRVLRGDFAVDLAAGGWRDKLVRYA
jgi:hypothetical protein